MEQTEYGLGGQQLAIPERAHHCAPPRPAKPRRRHDTFTLDLFPEEVATPAKPAPTPARAPASNGLEWMTTQITSMRAPEPVCSNNPRPAGVIRPGSGTDVLLGFLRRAASRWFFHHELVLALGRSKGEIDWALQYLVRIGRVESKLTELPARKPVLRYRLKSELVT